MVDISFTMILQWINFGVLLLILYYILFKPLVKFLDERSLAIKNDIEEAKAKNEKSSKLLAEYEEKMRAFQKEADDFMVKARKEAGVEREKILAEAHQDAEAMMKRSRAEIGSEIEAAKETLKKDFSKTAVRCAEKVLEKEISEKDHEALISQFLKSELK